ncbi:hypothetical protein [Pseudocolwellia agarivorans]|uniref:hypothetical protein n=1 Tax=Pseudocolwellia agarivorans TaxID=1911682 RepID=UPI0009860EF6|nr:hypothetical protein [Pseudocolwellia agarivorans]
MKKVLSFGFINILSENIAEIIINNNVVITLEMVDEYEQFLTEHFKGDFGLLINRVNHYSYTFEAKLTIGSLEGLKAMAVVYYNDISKKSTHSILTTREVDNFNLKMFSGLELGWQTGIDWLNKELNNI